MRRSEIKPGMQFVIPLRPRGFAVLVVAKYTPRARILVSYCFGPARHTKPAELIKVHPANASLIARVSDGALLSGDWHPLGSMHDFDREEWPTERFERRDSLARRYVVDYDPDDTTLMVSTSADSPDHVPDLPSNTLHDPSTLVGELSRLLDAKELLWQEWIEKRQAEERENLLD